MGASDGSTYANTPTPYSKYDGQRIFTLLQAVSNALSDATFSPFPTSINPGFK